MLPAGFEPAITAIARPQDHRDRSYNYLFLLLLLSVASFLCKTGSNRFFFGNIYELECNNIEKNVCLILTVKPLTDRQLVKLNMRQGIPLG